MSANNSATSAQSHLIARNFSAAVTTYESAAGVQAHFAEDLAEAIYHFIQRRETITTIAELGCGTGVFTRRLARRFPHSALQAIDISRAMLQSAGTSVPSTRIAIEQPRITFTEANAEDIIFAAPRDLIASNFCAQWFTNPLASLRHHITQSRYVAWTLLLNGTFGAWKELHAKFGYEAKIQAFVEEDELREMLTSMGIRNYELTISEAPLEFPSALDFVRHLYAIGAHTPRDAGVAMPLRRLIRAAAQPFTTSYRVAVILIEV